jgi:site-specific recombinase XerD
MENRSVSRPSKQVTSARAAAQRAKLDALDEARQARPSQERPLSPAKRKALLPKQRSQTTIELAIMDYLQDHEGGNHSKKTVQWHQTALGLFQLFLANERGITLVGEIDSTDVSAWFAYMRKTPASCGKVRSERTIQTYARSARAFCNWLVSREFLERSPFDRVAFPKVGKPLIRMIEAEEFEQLLLACTPPGEMGALVDRAASRNRAILWVLYDTGIRLSELCGLREGDFDRRKGQIIVKGKGSKERRIALGLNCQRHLLYYLEKHRADPEELADWGSPDEDHLFLAETRRAFTPNGVALLFVRLKKRVGITDKRISPHIFRHTFALRYLEEGGDPFSLQELLGHEDIATVKMYMHMNDKMIQGQKRKYSPGDHLPTRMPGPRETRRKGFQTKTGGSKTKKA